jgi:hypothetical protein
MIDCIILGQINQGNQYMPLSIEDSVKLVSAVNAYPIGVDEAIFPLGIKTKLGFDPVGPLLYPCSGSDVVYPIRMFPDVNELVLVDEHSLFNLDNLEITLQELSEVGKITNLSKGFGFLGGGYDYTNVHAIMQNQNEALSFHIDGHAVGALLLLRLRKLCGMEIKSIHEEVEGGVYTIIGSIDGKEKKIHYVNHYFGKQTKAYDWLQKQDFAFQSLFVKAFAPSINDHIINSKTFSQIRRLIKPERDKPFAVISEEDRTYTLNNGLPHLINPEKIHSIDNTPYDFGYGSRLVVGDYDSLYLNYPQHLLEQHNAQIQQRAHAEILKIDEIERESKAHEAYLKKSPQERFNYLQSKGYIEIKNNTLVIKVSEDKDFLSKINKDSLVDILNISKKIHINALELIIDVPRSNTVYQDVATSVAKYLSSAGSHIRSLSIKTAANIETSYLSNHSTKTAQALLKHGRHLSEIDVMVNDQGALEFANTIKHLKTNGNLTKASIRPILDWRDETRCAVSEALATVTTKPSKSIAVQLLEAVNKAQRNYAQHYQDNSKNARGPNGWFSWFRHGERGQSNARLFKERFKTLCAAHEHETIYSTLEHLFSADDTRYNRHSFASYLLDELSLVFKNNNKKEFIAVNGIYNSIDVLHILQNNLYDLLELQRVANRI